MQIKDESSQNPYAHPHVEHQAIDEPELPAAVKTGSLVGLIAVILGTLLGSLLASPDPSEIAELEEPEMITTSELASEPETTFESSTTAVTPPVTPPVTTSGSSPTDVTSTPSTVTTTDPTINTGNAVTSTPDLTNTQPLTATTSTPGVDTTTETTTGSALPDIETTTPETTTSVAPSAPVTTPQIAAATPPDAATLEQLSQSVFQTIDQAWTTTPVTGESMYLVKVDQSGSIIGFEPKSTVATDNVDNTPLPGLSSAGTAASPEFAEFNVTFLPSGTLEVNPAE